MMFLDEDGMVATDGGIVSMKRVPRQPERIVSELPPLGEATLLAEKFLERLRDARETRRHYRNGHGSF